jgi:DNA-binding transcriptional LysR family regulator
VAEELNFSRAAEKLFISQPPLSRQIKELELELKARLFERNNKRVVLTEAGKYFEKEVKELFQSLELISIKTRKISENVSGKYRIAYISSTFSGYISDLISHLTQKFPYVKFKLYEVPTAKQIAALELGKLDLGILRAPLSSPKIQTTLWFRDKYALVYSNLKNCINSDDDISRLNTENFIFFNKDYAPHFYDTLIQICANYGFVPNVAHEANNIGSIIQLVKNGLGVSIVPLSISESYPDNAISFWPFKKFNQNTEVLLATPKNEESEITKTALEYLLQKMQ